MFAVAFNYVRQKACHQFCDVYIGFMKRVCAVGPQLEDTYNVRIMQNRRCEQALGSTLMTELGENRGLCLSVRIHDDVRSADALFRQTRFNGYAQLVIL